MSARSKLKREAAVRQALEEMLAQGIVEIVARRHDGTPIYGLTSFGREMPGDEIFS
jgi:hypothetical protein